MRTLSECDALLKFAYLESINQALGGVYSNVIEQSKGQQNSYKTAKKASIARYQKQGGTIKQKVVGRNELCPCGSGIKYKKCCGK